MAESVIKKDPDTKNVFSYADGTIGGNTGKKSVRITSDRRFQFAFLVLVYVCGTGSTSYEYHETALFLVNAWYRSFVTSTKISSTYRNTNFNIQLTVSRNDDYSTNFDVTTNSNFGYCAVKVID